MRGTGSRKVGLNTLQPSSSIDCNDKPWTECLGKLSKGPEKRAADRLEESPCFLVSPWKPLSEHIPNPGRGPKGTERIPGGASSLRPKALEHELLMHRGEGDSLFDVFFLFCLVS